MGSKLGTLFARAGHEVVFSYARTMEKLNKLAHDAGRNARVGTPAEAAREAEALLLAVHWFRMQDLFKQAGDLSRKVIVTCSLPMNADDTGLVVAHTSSGAEERAKMLPNSRIVAAFHTVPSEVLFDVYEARGKRIRPSLVYCGDDHSAKAVAGELIRDVGFDPVDTGPLRVARYSEPFALCWWRKWRTREQPARNWRTVSTGLENRRPLNRGGMTALAGWQNFYVIVGSSAGALIGLQFVVLSLITSRRTPQTDLGAGHAFATPTIVHFAVVLGLSGILIAPWEGIDIAAVLWGLVGVGGIVYAVIVIRRMRGQTAYQPEFEDWLFHVLLPIAAYVTLAVSAYAAWSHSREALFAVGAAALLLLFVGIHNAWDAVTYHVFVRKPEG